MAAPTAGTWDVDKPEITSATSLPLRERAIAVGAAAAILHHLRVGFLVGPGHDGRHVLKALAVAREQLRQEIDVPAECDHAVPIARQYHQPLRLRHGPGLEVLRLIGLERRAILGLHQRHAELIEPVALTRALGIEHRGARYVIVGLRLAHSRTLHLARTPTFVITLARIAGIGHWSHLDSYIELLVAFDRGFLRTAALFAPHQREYVALVDI